jgi:anti-anti-sigma factor
MRSDPTPPSEGVASEPEPGRVAVQPVDRGFFGAVVVLHGEHDLATVSAIADALARVDGNVLVDLSPCTFLDSSAIGAIMGGSLQLERAGHVLEVVAPPDNGMVARTLEIVRLCDVVPVHPSHPQRERAPVGDQRRVGWS